MQKYRTFTDCKYTKKIYLFFFPEAGEEEDEDGEAFKATDFSRGLLIAQIDYLRISLLKTGPRLVIIRTK